MRPLRYAINLTLDGCTDHRVGLPDQELHHYAAGLIAQADALIFGRVTYQMMEEAWRTPAPPARRPDWIEDWMLPFADTIDAAKKYVVSSTLQQVDWNAELLSGPSLESAVRDLKARPGEGLFVGGVTLPKSLAELGLIDEYELIFHPRIAGQGPSLFTGMQRPLDLRLIGRHELGSGAVALRYVPRG